MRTFTKGKRWTRFVCLFTAVLVIASLVAVAAPAPAQAAHTPTVTLTPVAAQPNASRDYTLTVTNATSSANSINQVKLDVPPAGTGGSNFNVTVINNPTGWTSSFTTDQFGTRVDTITWSVSTGSAIGANESKAFTFTAAAPGTVASGLVWTVTTTDNAATPVSVTTTLTTNVESTGPTLVSVGWGDTDGLGAVNVGDTIVFTFSEAIAQSTITSGNAATSLLMSGTPTPDYGTTPTLAWNSAVTVLTLTVANAPTNAPAPGTTTVNPAGSVTDIAGNADNTTAAPTITENTPPTLVSIGFTNNDAPNTSITAGDALVFTFSEQMTTSTITNTNVATALPLSSGNYGTNPTVAWSGTGGQTIATVTLGTGASIASGTTVNPASTVTDLAGNADATATAIAILDNVKPTLTGIAFTNVDSDTGITASDTLAFTFSEAMNKTTITTANLATSLPLSAGLYGTGATASWDTAGVVLTVTLGTGVTIASGATVNPADSVTDLAAQADNTGGAGQAITDNVAPRLISVTWSDTDNLGAFNANDTLTFVFSEAMTKGDVTNTNVATQLPPSGGGSYGTGATILWNTSGNTLTVTLGTNPNLTAGVTTVDPANGVRDLAQNADATASPPTIVQVTLSLVPDSASVVKGSTVRVSVNVTNVKSFDAAAYTVNVGTAGVLQFVRATAGTIGTITIPVSAASSQPATGATTSVTVSQNVDGTAGVDGSGTLAVLEFTYTGNSGTSSALTFDPGAGKVTLANNLANAISANLSNTNVSSPLLRGDADGNGTLQILDVTAVELIVGGVNTTATTTNTPGADADANNTFNALDITKTELLVALAP